LNVACYRGNVLNRRQKQALIIFFMASELKAIGGNDYTGHLVTPGAPSLLDGATQLLGKTSLDDIGGLPENIGAFEVAIFLNNAKAAGANIAPNIATQMQLIKCLENVDDLTLRRMYIFLLCQLGLHKAYPQ
jgi:hypothetical protein